MLKTDQIKESQDFKLVRELRFNEILSFVIENITNRNFYSVFYFGINILFLLILLFLGIHGFSQKIISTGNFLSSLGWGAMAGSLFVIPFHEGLHALAFLLIGARKIRFGADLKQMIFYATAENFVAGRTGFTIVALMPFVVLNLVLLLMADYHSCRVMIFVFSTLFFHNIMCIGDFAMLSFFRKHKDKELYTFDDLNTKTAWFYEKIN